MPTAQRDKDARKVRAFDDDGNEVQVVTHNTICPAQHVEKARQMCWEYMQSLGNEDRLDQMLCDPLSPTGKLPATHYICTARMLEHQSKHAQREIDKHLGKRERGKKWVGGRLKRNNKLTHFCQYIGTRSEALRELGLKEIK